jgi:DNA-binding Lrp family transcriptional regulator
LENILVNPTPQFHIDASEDLVKPKRSVFVFITAENDSSSVALEDLRKMDEVKEVYLARGAYDLVAKITGESLEFLREEVLMRIKNLNSIKSTMALTIV